LHNLQGFVMGQTAGHISDLTPLHDLKQLKELSLDSAAIRDLTPIRELTNITQLSIGGTQVNDLSPIHNFRHLKVLNLGGAPVTDLSPLDMDTLKEMRITSSEVASLSTFPKKDNLKALSIFDSRVIDLSPVGQLWGLETLDLFISGPQGFDVSPLKRLMNLTNLRISGDGFQYFSPVKGLEAINGLHHLKKLSLFGVLMTDLSFVADLQSLEEITVVNAPVNNISALSRTKTLNSVSLTGTGVVDISPLLDLPELKTLVIIRTPARSDVLTELERRGVKVQR
jgi:internalin A